jgi:leader peptidase (prepilin peptidase)/N-methyltransferase
MGALVLLVTLRLREELVAAADGWLVVCGLPLSLVDIRIRRLPDPLTAGCAAGIAVLLTAAAATDSRWHDLVTAGAGAVATCVFFALLALAKPGSAGLGDAKLGLSTGALAAWSGWGFLLTSVFTAFVLAACYGLGLLMTRRASVRGSSVPFGPFLLAGCLAVVLLAG